MRVQRDMVLSQHREARDVLKTVCELRLEQAQTKLNHVPEEEQARLDSLGEDYDAATSPVVKRAAGKVEQLKTMLQRIEAEQDFGAYFINFAQQLL
jgi:polyhydroxyalkanoate synthesis regulator phasin